jgi:2-polyprenyl-6-methoxyphenol hydroxylase-like FAD-dependent oxidoreductase
VGVYPVGDGRLATFLLYRKRAAFEAQRFATVHERLAFVFGDMGWIVPRLLACSDPEDWYFDEVVQVEMPRWSQGRVVLLGDACHCPSLLAGQGASLALAGARLLAGELATADRVEQGLVAYETRLKPMADKIQKAGRRLSRWFLPANALRLTVRDQVLRMIGWPLVGALLKGAVAPAGARLGSQAPSAGARN